MSPKRNESLLESLTAEISSLQYGDSDNLDRLMKRAVMTLRGIFGEDCPYLLDLGHVSVSPGIYPASPGQKRRAWEGGVATFRNVLGTALEQLQVFGVKEEPPAGPEASRSGRRVFVVHGHDDALKQTVARVLERLELEPIILHEQPNAGRTIIEKFEDYADVSFAVVLLTPDDMGYEAESDPNSAKPRARQNVILELGFFLGRLRRKNVAVLYDSEVEIELPSDYDGVLYIPVDKAGRWQLDLVRELKAAGLEVDANKIT